MNDDHYSHASRRDFLRKAGALALAATPLNAMTATDTSEGVTFAAGPRPLVRYPGKREMILVHSRPPHLETPFPVFNEGALTPNDAFFVRYHLADIPTSIDPATFRLTVKGTVKRPLSLSLTDLKSMTGQTEIVAVKQCSGNSRGYFSPRVFGAQLGNGAMGNARWTGVPLKAVLDKAGISAGAKQVTFNGLDKPVLSSTPDFRKALDIDHALDGEPLLAWNMNGEELPFLNGYPLMLAVPGYYGTYWVKHLSEIEVIDHTFAGHDAFFMTKGYRIPDNDCNCVTPGTAAEKMRPIGKLTVRSFITSVKPGDALPAGRAVDLKGIAFDGGSGIKSIAVSVDGGQAWQNAALGQDLGRFSFREWHLPVTFASKGKARLMVRATSNKGEVQPMTATWNPAGYLRNVVESTPVVIG
ncbi:MAG: molybdopterin-dependent oxidoreductase [Gammaproteobacteria bacterium]